MKRSNSALLALSLEESTTKLRRNKSCGKRGESSLNIYVPSSRRSEVTPLAVVGEHKTSPSMLSLLSMAPEQWERGVWQVSALQLKSKGLAFCFIFTCLNPALGVLVYQTPASLPGSIVSLWAVCSSVRYPNFQWRQDFLSRASCLVSSWDGGISCPSSASQKEKVRGGSFRKPCKELFRKPWGRKGH